MGVHGHERKGPSGCHCCRHWLLAYHGAHALLRTYVRLIGVPTAVVLQQKTSLDAIRQMLCDSRDGHWLVPVAWSTHDETCGMGSALRGCRARRGEHGSVVLAVVFNLPSTSVYPGRADRTATAPRGDCLRHGTGVAGGVLSATARSEERRVGK